MSALPTYFPRVPLKQMDPSMLVFELDRETARLMPEACEMITSAATVASYLHRNQTRFVRGDMDRVPYIEHPLRVALRLVRWGVRDAALITAALLHDVAEDCADELVAVFGKSGETALDCLERLYGAQVAELVASVTNPASCGSKNDAARAAYVDHVADLANSGSHAVLIKASDLKDNAGSISYQLGHGKDARMLRMLTKYLPTVAVMQEGLAMSAALTPGRTAFSIAAEQMLTLLENLRELAREHDIEY